jgi:hypothetical protein
MTNDVDPDGDRFAFHRVDAHSLHGGAVAAREEGIVYTPAPNHAGGDEFHYEIVDDHGGVARGRVRVTVLEREELAVEDLVTAPAGNQQSATVVVAGRPGRVYRIQASMDFVTWVDVGTVTPDDDGIVRFLDPEAVNHRSRYYRTVYP